jgi:hypothetical protein
MLCSPHERRQLVEQLFLPQCRTFDGMFISSALVSIPSCFLVCMHQKIIVRSQDQQGQSHVGATNGCSLADCCMLASLGVYTFPAL